MLNKLQTKLFPPSCLFCHVVLTGVENGCCEVCLSDVHVWSLDGCRMCGKLMPASLAPGPCGGCLNHVPFQQSTQSLFAYQGAVRDAILAWKLQGHDAALHWLIQVASRRLQTCLDANDLLLPVPMPLSRMRKQGRHHAADLTAWMAQEVGCAWDWRILRRQGEQVRQSSLSEKQRQKNLRKAFVLDQDYWRENNKHYRRIWVIDDIITTGATVYYAAKVARALQAEVHVLSFSRVVK